MWDDYQPEDERGRELLDWCVEHELHTLNDGSFTRINRSSSDTPHPITQGRSSPDVTICGYLWKNNTTWNKMEAIGSSDHSPILITINEKTCLQPILKSRPRWRTKGVNWEEYCKEMERAAEEKMTNTDNVHTMAKELNDAILSEAKIHVGTIKPGKGTKSWMTPQVREAIRNRNKLRKQVHTYRQEWIDACRTTRDLINEAKTDAWRKVLDDASNAPNDSKLWRTVKNLNGTPEGNAPNEVMIQSGSLDYHQQEEGRRLCQPLLKYWTTRLIKARQN
jgi:hypothetical protein